MVRGVPGRGRRRVEELGASRGPNARELLRLGGIAEDLALSLQLLKLELPDHFGKLDVSQHAWTPSSGASGGNLPAVNQSSQHPYLRSHLLPHDYEVFDAERRRLFQRARAHGILLYNAPLV